MNITPVTKQKKSLEVRLKELMLQPLPGADAQLKMAPEGRIKDIFINHSDRKPLMSSVLILLYLKGGKVHVLFIRRPEYPGIHSGQTAFPGGRQEPADADHLATAIRETEEEIGIPQNKIKIAGQLTPLYIPPSNYMVYPFVATTINDPVFNPDPEEVADIVEIPFWKFLQSGIVKMMPPSDEFSFLEVPAYVIDDVIVWGATAMITAELIEMAGNYGTDKILKGF